MTTYIVTAPDPEFTGESCGVAFTDGTGSVSTDDKPGRQAVEYFGRRGYGLTPVSATEEGPEDGNPGEGGEAFDPSAHDAAEVIAYLDALDTDNEAGDAEFGRVIEAERAGKARKTVLALDGEG